MSDTGRIYDEDTGGWQCEVCQTLNAGSRSACRACGRGASVVNTQANVGRCRARGCQNPATTTYRRERRNAHGGTSWCTYYRCSAHPVLYAEPVVAETPSGLTPTEVSAIRQRFVVGLDRHDVVLVCDSWLRLRAENEAMRAQLALEKGVDESLRTELSTLRTEDQGWDNLFFPPTEPWP